MDARSRRSRSLRVAALALALAAGVAGCAGVLGIRPVPTRSYVLSAGTAPTDGVVSTPAASVGLLPVSIPDYLDRPSLVTRKSDDQLELAGQDLWAESLDRGTARVLVLNLTRLRPDRAFERFPWRRTRRLDEQLAVSIERFDGPAGGDVELVARWTVYAADGRTILISRRAGFREPAGGPGYDAMVAAMSRALARLSEAIAESLPR